MNETKSNETVPKEIASNETSITGLFLGLTSLGAGAYHGFCDAQGIPFQKENMEYALTYGPMLIQGAIYGAIGGFVGVAGGGIIGVATSKKDNLEAVINGAGGAALCGLAGAGVGGAIGALKGGFQTLIGYGIGYIGGYLTK